MTTPEGFWGGPKMDALEQTVRQLQDEVRTLRERGTRNAGALSILAPNGNTTFSSGPNTVALMPDGTPQWITVIRDVSGQARFTFWDPNPSVDGFIQALYLYDHLGQIVWTTDNNGGWAEPWLSVILYTRIGAGTGGAVFSYANTPVNVAEQVLWAGEVGYFTHPRIEVSGVWGQASGSGQTTRYRLKIGGATVGTWDVSGLAVDTRGPFDVASRVNDLRTSVELTAQSLAGTGNYACQVVGCHLRQT